MQTADEAFEPAQRKPKKPGSGGNWWWILMLHVTWIILLAIGVLYGLSSWKFARQGEEVPATVIELAESHSSDSGTTYSPVFQYRVDGRTYTYESINSSDPPSHRVGEQVTLLVDPDDPERARENSFWELWLLPVIMCPIALMTALISIVATVVTKPWQR